MWARFVAAIATATPIALATRRWPFSRGFASTRVARRRGKFKQSPRAQPAPPYLASSLIRAAVEAFDQWERFIQPLVPYRLAIIVLVAFLLRSFDIDASPLLADEYAGVVGVGDLVHGRTPFMPFIDLRTVYLPLYGIFEYISSTILGQSPLALRLPAVLLGVVSVLALRWLALELAESVVIADLSAAIFAVLPWAVHMSRIAWENAALFPFFLSGLAALYAGLNRKNGRFTLLGAALLAIGAYSYQSEIFDATILAFALLLISPRRTWDMRRSLLIATVAAIALVAPLVIEALRSPHFFVRDLTMTTFGHYNLKADLVTFSHNYIAHFALFNPTASPHDSFVSIEEPGYGELYWWMLPFAILGIARAPRTIGARNAIFLYIWFVIYPLGGALTNSVVPNWPRVMIGAPLACIFVALGLQALRQASWNALSRQLTIVIISLIAIFSTLQFAHEYYFSYPIETLGRLPFGTTSMFRTIRMLEPWNTRVCFLALSTNNYDATISFYLAGSSLETFEGSIEPCRSPRSLIVSGFPLSFPWAQKAFTEQTPSGVPYAYIYATSFK